MFCMSLAQKMTESPISFVNGQVTEASAGRLRSIKLAECLEPLSVHIYSLGRI